MSQISIYYPHQAVPDKLAAKLLEKVYDGGQRAIVYNDNPAYIEHLNALLWTYSQISFLPHGAAADGEAARQPIWLTDQIENPNQAQVLITFGPALPSHAKDFEKVVCIVDSADATAVTAAQNLAKTRQANGDQVVQWQQNTEGQWVQA